MIPQRLTAILDKVYSKYEGQRITPLLVQTLYNDISAVLRGLHKTEHFLNFVVDFEAKSLLIRDEETMNYLGLLPYLDKKLQGTEELFIVYFVKGNEAFSQCAVKFKDLYNYTPNSVLGFDVEVFPLIPLGIYYPDTDEFERWRES